MNYVQRVKSKTQHYPYTLSLDVIADTKNKVLPFFRQYFLNNTFPSGDLVKTQN